MCVCEMYVSDGPFLVDGHDCACTPQIFIIQQVIIAYVLCRCSSHSDTESSEWHCTRKSSAWCLASPNGLWCRSSRDISYKPDRVREWSSPLATAVQSFGTVGAPEWYSGKVEWTHQSAASNDTSWPSVEDDECAWYVAICINPYWSRRQYALYLILTHWHTSFLNMAHP